MYEQKFCNASLSCFTKLFTHFSFFDILLLQLKYSEPYSLALGLLPLK